MSEGRIGVVWMVVPLVLAVVALSLSLLALGRSRNAREDLEQQDEALEVLQRGREPGA